MELRQHLDILRRRAWFIVEAVVLVALAAGIASNLQTPQYESAARVLLRPDDPTERLNPDDGQRAVRDPNRYVQSQRSIIESEDVVSEAARTVPGARPRDIARKVSVKDGDKSDVLKIVGRDGDPALARDMANAVARTYIENRRRSAVAGLDRAVKEIQAEPGPLQTTIAELDAKIAATQGSSAGASAQPQPPPPPEGAPSPPPPAIQQNLTAGGQPTSSEALKAVRYAAAVQYETLFRRLQELRIDITLKRGEAELISLGTLPSSPVSPQPIRDTVVGAVVGLLLGVALVVLREQLDDRLRSVQAVEQATGLAVLAQLPYDEETAAGPGQLAAVTRPKAPLTEAVRALRTSVEYLSIDEAVRVIVVTSAAPGEGKSFVSANLAALFADAGYRTLLLSADLRRPGISRLFDVPARSPGLTNVVVPVAAHAVSGNGAAPPSPLDRDSSWLGYTSFGPVAEVVKTPMRNLLFLPSGPVPPNPAELLASQRMTEVLNELRQKADVVVIDTPPLLPVTDAAVLAAKSDGVLLVTALGETRRSAAQRAKAILDGTQARILGVVVNKVPRSSALYGYDGYYQDPEPERRRARRKRAKAGPPQDGPHAGPEKANAVEVPGGRRRRKAGRKAKGRDRCA